MIEDNKFTMLFMCVSGVWFFIYGSCILANTCNLLNLILGICGIVTIWNEYRFVSKEVTDDGKAKTKA